jgi:hypothetical protein
MVLFAGTAERQLRLPPGNEDALGLTELLNNILAANQCLLLSATVEALHEQTFGISFSKTAAGCGVYLD